MEVLDTPKRSKSVKTKSGAPLLSTNQNSGWEAAFNPRTAKGNELVKVEDANGDAKGPNGGPDSPESIAFEDFKEQDSKDNVGGVPGSARKRRKRPHGGKRATELTDSPMKNKKQSGSPASTSVTRAIKKTEREPWKLSAPIGGRMINADPVYSEDEK